MYGAPDRGGGREGKKKSLRNNKIKIVEQVKAQQKGHTTSTGPAVTAPPPTLRAGGSDAPLVDCGVQLINRQFDRDQLKVLQRAAGCGVECLIAFTSDFEKLELLHKLSRENMGVVYCMVGVHTDMIKRSNDKLSTQRLEQLQEAAMRPETVALMAGLDFSRDMGIRYAQERALQQQMEMAAQLQLPLVLYQVAAGDALLEKVQEFRDQQQQQQQQQQDPKARPANAAAQETRIAVYNFAGTADELGALIGLGCSVVLSGRVADPSEAGEALRAALLASCPLNRVLLCSDAPYHTPQNIEDAFMREGRNEPSNLPYVVRALAGVWGLGEREMAERLWENAREFFGLQRAAPAEAAAVADGPEAASKAQATGLKAKKKAGLPHGGGDDADGEERRSKGGQAHRPVSDDDEDEDEDSEAPEEEGEEEDAVAVSRSNRFGGALLSEHSDGDEGEGSDEAGQEASPASGRQQQQQQQQQQQRRQRLNPQPDVVPAKKPGVKTFLGEAAGDRVTYACRACRSVLLAASDIRQHQPGGADVGRAEFKKGAARRAGGKAGKGKQAHEDHQLCSMHFLARPLAWMAPQLSAQGGADASERPEAAAAAAAAEAEGRLSCPGCNAKLGKFSIVDGLDCSCGAEMPAPAYGLLRARLDLVDLDLDLAKAVQSTLRLYEDAEELGDLASGSSDDEGRGKKKKKKQVKGRGNTSNFSSYRNKAFGQSAKPKQAAPSSAAAADDKDGGDSDN